MTNPVLDYQGPESRSIEVRLILFDASERTTRGVIAAAETTPGESEALWADAGPLAWVSWAGDPTQVEFAEYTDPARGVYLQRRVIRGERVSGSLGLTTAKLWMQRTETVLPGRTDFSSDYDSDYAIQ